MKIFSENRFSGKAYFYTIASRETNGTDCVPWYLPNIESNSTMCDPWDALKFVHYMENVPDGKCNHCMPDCQSLTYTEVSHKCLMSYSAFKCTERHIWWRSWVGLT